MYKDVWKRILAVVMTVCLVITFVQWPTTVKAEGKIYHIYQYGGIERLNTVPVKTAAAVFIANQNEDQNGEILERASFDVYVEENADTSQMMAQVSYYIGAEIGNPNSGKFVAANTIYGLKEGSNELSFDLPNEEMEPNTSFSIIVSLTGEGVSFYANEYKDMGYTYVLQEDGTWKDMAAEGMSLSVRATTYDVKKEDAGIVSQVTEALSPNADGVEAIVVQEGEEAVSAGLTLPESTLVPEDTAPTETTIPEESTEVEPTEPETTVSEEATEPETTVTEEATEPETTVSEEPEEPETTVSEEPEESETTVSEEVTEPETTATEESAEPETAATEEPTETGATTPEEPAESETAESEELAQPETAVPTETTTPEQPEETEAAATEEPTETETTVPEDTASTETSGFFTVQEESMGILYNTNNISLDMTSLVLGENQEYNLTLTNGAGTTDIKWESEDDSTVSVVQNGTEAHVAAVKANKVGKTNIKATTLDGQQTYGACTVTVVALDMAIITLGKGQSHTVRLTNATDVNDIKWVSMSPGVVTVQQNDADPRLATVTAVGDGSAVINVTTMNGQRIYDSCAVTVVNDLSQANISFSWQELVYDGTLKTRPSVTLTMGDSTLVIEDTPTKTYQQQLAELLLEETWTFTDTAGGSVSGQWGENNIGKNAGTYTYMLNERTGTGGIPDYTGSIEADVFQVKINPKDVTRETIDVEWDTAALRTVTGEITDYMQYIDRVAVGGQTLTPNSDYTVEGVTLRNGRKVAILYGKGNYCGEQQIVRPMFLETAVIELEDRDEVYIYKGEKCEPRVKVTLDGRVLALDTDYEVVGYENNIHVGSSAKVTIRGKGIYSGEQSKTFSIQPKALDNSDNFEGSELPRVEVEVKSVAGTPTLVVTYNGEELQLGRDYTVTPTIGSSGVQTGTSYTITAAAGGNYTGEIADWSYGNTNLTYYIESLLIGGVADYETDYNGSEQTPTVRFQFKAGRESEFQALNLREGTDYTISYSGNKDAGTATVIVKGIGIYNGEVRGTFTINQISLNDCTIDWTDGEEISYSPVLEEVQPELTVEYNGTALVLGTDFDLVYQNGNGADFTHALGAKKMKVTGIGNFKDTKELSYEIIACNLRTAYQDGKIRLEIDSNMFDYAGVPIDPGIKLVYYSSGEEHTLAENTDYTVQYDNDAINGSNDNDHTNVGNVRFTLTAAAGGNYTGSIGGTNETMFEIVGKAIEDCVVELDTAQDGFVANYQAQGGIYAAMLWFNAGDNRLKFTVKDGGYTLVEGQDYTLTYDNDDEMSKAGAPATVTIEATHSSGYHGSITIAYLLAKDLGAKNPNATNVYWVNLDPSISEEDCKYTGEPVVIDDKISVVGSGETLTVNEDYWIEYENNTEATFDQAIALIHPMAVSKLPTAGGCYHYKSTAGNEIIDTSSAGDLLLQKNFLIYQASIDDIVVEAPIEKKYTGSPIELTADDFQLSYNGKALELGRDFEISGYDNNTGPTTSAIVKIKGKENHNGTKNFDGQDREIEFTITRTPPTDLHYKINDGNPIIYNGQKQQPPVDQIKIWYYEENGTRIELEPGKFDIDFTWGDEGYQNNVNVGTASVFIKGTEGEEFEGLERELTFVIDPMPLTDSNCEIRGVPADPLPYTSEEIVPVLEMVKLTWDNGEETLLTEGTDYELSYQDNKNFGTAKILLTGKGNYTGVIEKTFTIEQVDITDSSKVVVADITTQGMEYGMMVVCPVPEITYTYDAPDRQYVLVNGKDFTCTYTNNNRKGNATVTVEGKNNFYGSVTKEFVIGTNIGDESIVEVVCEEGPFVYENGTTHEPKVTVKDITTGRKLTKDTHYKVEYQNNQNASTADNPAKIIITGIGGRYGGTRTIPFEIQPKNIAGNDDITLKIGEVGKEVSDGSYEAQYTGEPVVPSVILMDKTHELLNGSDYEVYYNSETNLVAPSEPSLYPVELIIKAKEGSNYTGSVETSFKITERSIGDGTAFAAQGISYETIPLQGWVAEGAKPTPKVYFNGNELRYDANDPFNSHYSYEYRYENADKRGNATVKIVGNFPYTGSILASFQITDNIDSEHIEVTGLSDVVSYKDFVDQTTGANPSQITLPIELKDITDELSPVTLTEGTDYEVIYENNTKPGIATVTIRGIRADLAGEIVHEFKIKADLYETMTETDTTPATQIIVGDQAFTGEQLRPEPIVKYRGITLTKDVDYTITSYGTNVVNQGTIAIQGEGAYTGLIPHTFQIRSDSVGFQVYLAPSAYKYRGEQIKPEPLVYADSNDDLLQENSHYTLEYGANTEVGRGQVLVIGSGNYSNLVATSKTFDILAHDINDLTVEVSDAVYTGAEILPEDIQVELSFQDNGRTYVFERGRDYTVRITGEKIKAGESEVTLIGDGTNIRQSVTVPFTISQKPLKLYEQNGDIKVTLAETLNGYRYNPEQLCTPEVVAVQQVDRAGTVLRTLIRSEDGGSTGDYTVRYENNDKAGTAKVVIEGYGNYTGRIEKTFTIQPYEMRQNDVNVKVELPDGENYAYMGTGGVKPEVNVTYKEYELLLGTNKDYTVTYEENDELGWAKLIVQGRNNYAGTIEKKFKIVRHDISDEDVVKYLEIPDQTYTGTPIVPYDSVRLELPLGNGTSYELQYGTDYILEFHGADHKEIGRVAMTIRGIDGFTGTIDNVCFNIVGSMQNATVTGLRDSYTFTGSQIPTNSLGITQVSIGGTILAASYYELVYVTDGMSVGRQTLLLKGRDRYENQQMELTFNITPKNIRDTDIELLGMSEQLPYGETVQQNITLQWGAITLVEGTDYTVECRPTNTSEEWQMIVRGTGNYTGEINKTFRIERSSLESAEVTGVSSVYTYNGAAFEPNVRVKIGETVLAAGADYSIEYRNNTNAGVATIVLTGIGNYAGEKKVSFSIQRRKINVVTVDPNPIPTQLYTGLDIKPSVTVKDSEKVLAQRRDYDLLYSNNRKAGTGKISVAGIGNYTGTKTLQFDIRPGATLNVSVVSAASSKVKLAWNGEGNVTGYEIYRADGSGRYTMIARKKGTTFTDESFTAGSSYKYKVRAYLVTEKDDGTNDTYYGDFSDIVEGTI